MPSISYDGFAAWSNYHLTLGAPGPHTPVPSLTVESLGKVHAADTASLSGLERFAATATPLMAHLSKLSGMMHPEAPAPARSFAAGLTGRGWSFSPLIGAPVSQLLCEGLAGTRALEPDERHAACRIPADRIALASGGTRLREIVNWAEARDLTIETSGTHLGATIAGAAATASHGSRLGFGGTQDMILGMHLVVGEDEHLWIEPASSPILSDAGLARLAAASGSFRVVRDDDLFQDALVHLGAMGIVNGVALALVPNLQFALMLRHAPIDDAWLEELGRGDFARTAERLQCAASPIFYELTLNPHAAFADNATHMMYFVRTPQGFLPPGDADILRPADAIAQLGALILANLRMRDQARAEGLAADDPHLPTPVTRVLRLLLNNYESAFAFYRATGQFEPNDSVFDPDEPARDGYYWSGLHKDEITGDIPGTLYNASYAIPCARLASAIPAISAAVAGLEPSFVFTVRFVAKPAGTLAFTRFDDNAVIEIDGLSPLICQLARGLIDPAAPDAAELLAALGRLEGTLERGALAVRAALEDAGIPYSMHWAKLGRLDKAKVQADFGHPGDDESLIRRWRAARDQLLGESGRALFWNDHVVALGLLDPPALGEAPPP